MEPEERREDEFERLPAQQQKLMKQILYELNRGVAQTLSQQSLPCLRGHSQWEALLAADRSLQFKLINEFILQLINTMGNTKSVQIIEANLRAVGAATWLVARKPVRGLKSWHFAHNTKAKFTLWVSMRPIPVALSELLQESQSYEENFDKLMLTDMISVIDQQVFRASAKELEKKGHRFQWFD